MEVHAHTHTERKKWTHYLWEFVMLFLAVTLGFFVENKREHNVEQKRAKDFSSTLYAEIKNDTVSLGVILKRTEIAYHSLDTLIELLNDPDINKKTGLLYYHCGLGMYNSFFTANEATLQQLKSSGAIRYFQNFHIISAITEYEYIIRFLYQLETNTYLNFMETRKLQMKIFDIKSIYSVQAWDTTYTEFQSRLALLKDQSITLLNQEQGIIAEFRNWALNRMELDRYKVNQYKRLLASAGKLLNILNKEYHLSESTPLEE